jgi:hypothetical protein
MNKFLSDMYDIAKAGTENADKRIELLDSVGGLDDLREHIGGIDISELHWMAYDIKLNELINDKEDFIDTIGRVSEYFYSTKEAEESIDECIDMALSAGLVKSREEARQKYAADFKEMFYPRDEED